MSHSNLTMTRQSLCLLKREKYKISSTRGVGCTCDLSTRACTRTLLLVIVNGYIVYLCDYTPTVVYHHTNILLSTLVLPCIYPKHQELKFSLYILISVLVM